MYYQRHKTQMPVGLFICFLRPCVPLSCGALFCLTRSSALSLFLFLVAHFTTRLPALLVMFPSTLFSVTVLLLAGTAHLVQAHIAPWTRGIWECTDGKEPVRTLLLLKFGADSQWCLLHRIMTCPLSPYSIDPSSVQMAGGSTATACVSPLHI